ncbi:MAG TPA: EAL domain-containing protein, partial [Kineosporiaceae bacterium]|nr:EAL domain-containing protein [Kineosporiaceae bacterium]
SRLGEGESFEARLRVLAHAVEDVRCLVAEHEVTVEGRTVGRVGMADRDRYEWSADDLAALAEAADVVSARIQARLAKAEVARVQQLVSSHNQVHDMIARSVPLREVLTAACEAIERYDPSLMPSVLQRDPESNTLHSGLGPSFPQAYLDAVEGAPIGPSIGTCGPAAWFGQLTISENLDEDPNWGPIRGLSQMVGVAHCWSMPAKDSTGEVLGTLAFYGRAPRTPGPEHLALLQDWARVVGTAIERSRNRDQLTHDARHDGLTGLPNRVAIFERLDFALRHVRPEAAVAVLFIDLDGLKAMNDTLGHDVADEMLRTQAGRLSRSLRGNDFVGRFGGDEFIVIAEGVRDADEAGGLGARLLEAIAQPLTGLTSMAVTASIGVALVRSDDIDAKQALRKADEAMYEAKRAGKDRCVFAEIGESIQASRRVQLARALRGAETRGEMHIVYQPIVALPTRKTVAVEALLRWTNPEVGDVGPAEFIPVAEDTGSILPIGAWVLLEACAAIAPFATGHGLDLHVNVSARQVTNPDFATWVRQTLAHAEYPPDRLVLEITEATLTRGDEVALTNLRDLVALGVRIALDDVGVGHFSLEWLHDGPLSIMKLDRALIARLGTERGRAITAGVITAAHGAGCIVTAEGVETDDELHHLQDLHCDTAQGFHIATPRPLEDLPYLATDTTKP